MTLQEFFIEPFHTYGFLRRALVAAVVLSIGCAPVGVLLVLRRMSLMGDALSHSVMPGVAIGYLLAGLSLPVMGLGGFIAGLLVAFLATYVAQKTQLKEDASFVSFYLIALALGTLLISIKGVPGDLNHILFGTILGVSTSSLMMITTITSLTLIIIACIYRPLVVECFDSSYLRSIYKRGHQIHGLFMGLVVLNMVAAFQTMGTLMALGLMMLPAISARFWCRNLTQLFLVSMGIGLFSAWGGLLISCHLSVPSGPAIICVASLCYLVSLGLGSQGSLLRGQR